MSSQSAIYAGRVRHRRYAERAHAFEYPIHMAYLDLDEIPYLLGGRLVRRRPGIVRFRRRDYLGDPATPLADCVRDLVQQRTGCRPLGPVRMLTNLRVLGHCFNPVSFYYCFQEDGERLQAVAAEVTNTPWGERHTYVVEAADPHPQGDGVAPGARVVRGESEKQLHVSPFMGMDHCYRWTVSRPGRDLQVHIASHRACRLAFDATLSLKRRPLTRRGLARVTAAPPSISIGVLARIYGQALRLRLKGVAVHPHPEVGAR